jgi:hypothetical protein
MWELPEMPEAGAAGHASLTLRHSITVTDYIVRVMQNPPPNAYTKNGTAGRWVRKERIARLPLTGLTRKILRQAQVI